MQQSFILPVLAAALALSAPARADSENVNVYGQANVSYDMLNTGEPAGVGTAAGISSNRVSSNSSFLGLRGSSELGKGWSAEWQMEGTVGTDTGTTGGTVAGASVSSARLLDRNTYLGLSNESWGKLLLGRHDTPYKMSTRRLDLFADGIADNRSMLGTTLPGAAINGGVVTETFDTRQSNLVAYFSPELGGISVAIAYSNLAENNMNKSQDSVSALSLAAMYKQDAVYTTLAYEVHTTDMPLSQTKKSIAVKAGKLGIGYKMGILDLGFIYEKSSDDHGNANPYDGNPGNVSYNPCGGLSDGANCSGHDTLYFSAKFDITVADAFKLAKSKTGQAGTASNGTSAHQFSMGFDHVINERTSVYVLYTVLKNDSLVRYGLSNAATSGAHSVNATGVGGASPSAFSFGMRHKF